MQTLDWTGVLKIACKDVDIIVSAFHMSCKIGNIKALKHLQKIFNLTSKQVKDNGCGAFVYGCYHGHFSVVKWLVSDFNFNADDVREFQVLKHTCGSGNLHIAQWATSTYNLTDDDARADNYVALRGCWQSGNKRAAEWLISTFNIEEWKTVYD